jgi:hypothetical protein
MAVTLEGAVFSGTTVTLTFTGSLRTADVAPAQFTVKKDGVPVTVNAVTITGPSVVLTCASALSGVVLVSYANPAQVAAPTPPGQNYTIPGGATSVTDGATLQTALNGGTAIDIVLENGTYDKASNFTRGAAHRLYARNALQAVLTAAIDAGSNSLAAGEYHGLKFNVTDAAKLAFTSQLVTWGSGATGGNNILVEDCEFDGGASRTPTYLLRLDRPNGAIVRRCRFKNALDYGARLSDNSGSSTAVITTCEDIEAENIYRASRGASNGTAESGLWVGHQVTNHVRRVKVRNTGWMGVTPVNACKNTTFFDIDVDVVHGVAPDTSIIGTGIYAERVTQNIVFERFLIGPDLFVGINGEWNDGTPGNAAFNGVIARHGRMKATRTATGAPKRRGFYSDSGGRDVQVYDVVFDGGFEHSCVGVNNDDSGATTLSDIHHNIYTREPSAARVTWTIWNTYPATEQQTSDGDPPRRLLASLDDSDVASFTDTPAVMPLAGAPTFKVEVAFASNPGAAPVWTDVTAFVQAWHIKRGRQKELDRIDAGTATVRLNNSDRRFDPTHASSPYAPNVLPMRRIRISATHVGVTYRLFSGYVDAWPQTWQGPHAAISEVAATDGFKPLAHVDVGEGQTWSREFSGARINRLLDAAGWPAGDRVIDAGQTEIAEQVIPLGSGITALNGILETADAELGTFFIDGQGRAVFHDRLHRRRSEYLTSAGTFADANTAGTIKYQTVELDADADRIWNDVQVTASGGEPARAQDAGSQTKYLRRTLARQIPAARTAEAQDQADYLVSQLSEPRTRLAGITVVPRDDDGWKQALARDLADHVTVRRLPQNVGAAIVQEASVESIDLAQSEGRFRVTWLLTTPAYSAVDWWLLGHATYGVLGSTTKVVY